MVRSCNTEIATNFVSHLEDAAMHKGRGTYVLDEPAHTRLRNTTSAENLHSVDSSLLCRSRAVHLQKCNLSDVMESAMRTRALSQNKDTYPASF